MTCSVMQAGRQQILKQERLTKTGWQSKSKMWNPEPIECWDRETNGFRFPITAHQTVCKILEIDVMTLLILKLANYHN